MTLTEIRDTFLQFREPEIISYINTRLKELKLSFINAELNVENSDLLSKIMIYLGAIQLSEVGAKTKEMQFLYTELAFFFKRNNEMGPVTSCLNLIEESVLKSRLKAWLHHKQYTDINSHIALFKKYLKKLSLALTDGFEDYGNEVLRDLNNYVCSTNELLIELGFDELITSFNQLFESPELLKEFPLLAFYSENKHQFETDLAISQVTDEIFEPSAFTAKLFENKFLFYIKTHPNTDWHNILLGYDNYTIRSKIIKFGQAEFDTPYETLSTSDVVHLYAYFNMRKHYYSSLYVFQRLNLVEKFYSTVGRIKFIDIGCGPATSAIALTDHIYSFTNSTVKFDYFGIDFYKSMRSAAENFMDNEIYEKTDITCYLEDLTQIEFSSLKDANCILINTCYLFASESLKEDNLAQNIVNLRRAYPETPFFLLFQNTTDKSKNDKYLNFKTYLPKTTEILSEKTIIKYNNHRNSYYPPTQETVFIEILEFH